MNDEQLETQKEILRLLDAFSVPNCTCKDCVAYAVKEVNKYSTRTACSGSTQYTCYHYIALSPQVCI